MMGHYPVSLTPFNAHGLHALVRFGYVLLRVNVYRSCIGACYCGIVTDHVPADVSVFVQQCLDGRLISGCPDRRQDRARNAFGNRIDCLFRRRESVTKEDMIPEDKLAPRHQLIHRKQVNGRFMRPKELKTATNPVLSSLAASSLKEVRGITTSPVRMLVLHSTKCCKKKCMKERGARVDLSSSVFLFLFLRLASSLLRLRIQVSL